MDQPFELTGQQARIQRAVGRHELQARPGLVPFVVVTVQHRGLLQRAQGGYAFRRKQQPALEFERKRMSQRVRRRK